MIHTTRYMREISCRYCKIYHYLVLRKTKEYMVESHTTHSSLRDVLKMSWVRSQDVPRRTLWIYLNVIGYRKILIGHFMTSYEILQYPTISFWDVPNTAHGISVGSPLSIWDNLRYPQDKVCYVGIFSDILEWQETLNLIKFKQYSCNSWKLYRI